MVFPVPTDLKWWLLNWSMYALGINFMGRKQETNLLAFFRKTHKSQNTKIVNHLEIRFCKVWLNCDTMIRNLSSSCDRQAMLPLQLTLNDYISFNFSEDNWVGNTWLIMECRLSNQSAVLVLYIYSPSNTTQQHMAQLLDTYQINVNVDILHILILSPNKSLLCSR